MKVFSKGLDAELKYYMESNKEPLRIKEVGFRAVPPATAWVEVGQNTGRRADDQSFLSTLLKYYH